MKYVGWVIGWLCWSVGLYAQSSQEEVAKELFESFRNEFPEPYLSFAAQQPDPWIPHLKIDSTGTKSMLMYSPDVKFQRLGKGVFSRTITLKFEIQDSLIQTRTYTFTDEVQRESMKSLRKQSAESLAGNDPTLFGNWGRPIILIGTSVAGIVALFLVRSEG
ncbi:hypothetical protein [Pontibacter sp. G13]|uniref:hypothetical protein n=1 Tax=Pontibacter sp. G13 TaxID=3074898 RepID=UPI00288BB6D3|nr:hypothetical protein [Pontibacter sp. G13]WNJ16079.1 hypothetical protein RJD25_14545 [Pontibacter sp. G13]